MNIFKKINIMSSRSLCHSRVGGNPPLLSSRVTCHSRVGGNPPLLSSRGLTAGSTKKFLFIFFTIYFLPCFANFEYVSKLKRQGSQVSALVLRLNDQKIIGQISPNTHLIPASTTKLALAAQALDTWGPDKKFRSIFLARGHLKDTKLEGDLIFYGGGDPAFLNENMPDFLYEIEQLGITEITGHLIVNNSLFGALKQDQARASGQKYSQNAYDAPLSASAINYSVLAVAVSPGNAVGSKPNINIDPFNLPSVTIINRATTTKRGSRTNLTVERTSTPTKDIYTVSGHIALNAKERKVYRSVSNPDRYAGEILIAYLKNAGIKVAHSSPQIENTPIKSTDKILFTILGSPVSDHLNGLLKQSNNFIADMLLMDLNITSGSKLSKQNAFTIKDQSDVLEKYLKKKVKDKDLVINSGSGLTPSNRLSAKNLVSLLNQIYQNKEQFNIFLNSLTTPGEVGTLEYRFNKYASLQNKTILRAKTGTLSSPCYAVSLAGFGRTLNNEWIGFAVIVNSKNQKNSPSIPAIQGAIDKDIMAYLQTEVQL